MPLASSTAVAAAAPVLFEDYLKQYDDVVKPPIPKMSQYRALRGKSVSSLKRVYSGPPSEGSHLAEGDCYPRLDTPTLARSTIPRKRSKSVASVTFARRRPPPSPTVATQTTAPPPLVSSVSAGSRGVALIKGLAESVTGVIGGLTPRLSITYANPSVPSSLASAVAVYPKLEEALLDHARSSKLPQEQLDWYKK
ncbi:hypothetical protein FDECE_9732, partial [Fusarium decemcellulare]